MLSLFRWGLGSNHEHHLINKTRIQEEGHQEGPQGAMSPGPVKRKRGKSTQSAQRPAKRNPKPSKDSNAPMNNDTPQPSGEDQNPTPDNNAQMEAMEWEEITNMPGTKESNESEDKTDRNARLREAISRQFNLEILLKHNELRLIDQEIAKVQIALEQLRRCSIIPYPSMTSKKEDMLNVAHAKGIPAPRETGKLSATAPPPWGVVDGPYSRHYAKWLLPDPIFDGGSPEPPRTIGKAGKTVPERHTRGGKEISLPMTKPRPRAGLSRYQALAGASGEHKDTKGPMILKRALDGKLVKLVCINCHREDFNSAQGFINHCRIAHSHNLASHEAAARECGQEIDPNEVVETAPEMSTPTIGSLAPVAVALVHPMNRPQMPPVPRLSLPRPKRVAQTSITESRQPVNQDISTSFKPSAQVPHLSRLFAKLGKSVDLTAAVKDATTRDALEDTDADSGPQGDSESDEDTTPTATGMARIPSRISTRGGPSLSSGSHRPKSQKGPDRVVRRPYGTQAKSTQITLPDRRDAQDLSPHTITSVNAPSLISDSDNASSDDEYGSNVHHEGSSNSEVGEEDGTLDEDDIDVDMNHEFPLRDGFRSGHGGSTAADPELSASSKARSHHSNSESGRPRLPNRGAGGTQRRRGRRRGA